MGLEVLFRLVGLLDRVWGAFGMLLTDHDFSWLLFTGAEVVHKARIGRLWVGSVSGAIPELLLHVIHASSRCHMHAK